jgi:hypothetical protein
MLVICISPDPGGKKRDDFEVAVAYPFLFPEETA